MQDLHHSSEATRHTRRRFQARLILQCQKDKARDRQQAVKIAALEEQIIASAWSRHEPCRVADAERRASHEQVCSVIIITAATFIGIVIGIVSAGHHRRRLSRSTTKPRYCLCSAEPRRRPVC